VPDALRILCLNGGSSSLKFTLYDLGDVETRLATGAVRRLDGTAAAVEAVIGTLEAQGQPAPTAVGHRLVHGGPEHVAPERVDERLMTALRGLVPFAPLHLPGEIAGIEAVAAHLPGLPQVVCFDTAFHRRMPELAQRLPLPRALWDEGIRRYGFHGLSYEYVVQALGAAARGRLVVAHLGNGASLAAIRDGLPIDTTMGLTPTGGVMMGTRSGDLDPGVLLHLLARGYDAAALERLVDHEAGLLGVSGITADMQTLLAQRAYEPHAAQAVDMFCYHVRKHVGALAAVLGGLDTLVFTGGIGERAVAVRACVCDGLAHLGIRLDAGRNAAHAAVISADNSACAVRVVPTDEDLMIARHTRRVLAIDRRNECRSA
jgi:acetate kinase